jgi:hypothetical protein
MSALEAKAEAAIIEERTFMLWRKNYFGRKFLTGDWIRQVRFYGQAGKALEKKSA